jgi:MoxR-like ATPase
VQALAPVVLSHRIMLVPEAAGVERGSIVADAVSATPAL